LASTFGTKASSQGINFLDVTSKHDDHLTAYFEEWSRRFNEESDPGGMISTLEALVGHLHILDAQIPGAYSAAVCYPCVPSFSLFSVQPVDVSLYSLVSYSRLVMYSFGFQHAFQRGIGANINVFLAKVCAVETLYTKSSHWVSHSVSILQRRSLSI
jgi:hypothetical protein